MVFKDLCVLVLWKRVASALQRLTLIITGLIKRCYRTVPFNKYYHTFLCLQFLKDFLASFSSVSFLELSVPFSLLLFIIILLFHFFRSILSNIIDEKGGISNYYHIEKMCKLVLRENEKNITLILSF